MNDKKLNKKYGFDNVSISEWFVDDTIYYKESGFYNELVSKNNYNKKLDKFIINENYTMTNLKIDLKKYKKSDDKFKNVNINKALRYIMKYLVCDIKIKR